MMRFAVLVFSLPAAAAQFIGAIGIAPLPVERAPAPCVEDINADGSVDGNSSRHIVAVEILSRV
jgi:hypothetical protein